MSRFSQLILTLFVGLSLATGVAAEQLCNGQDVQPMPDGRMLGHLPYAEAAPATLVAAPVGFALGAPCMVNRDMAPDLARMLIAARASLGVGGGLRAVSCFRTIAHQRAVFCSQIGPRKRCANAAERARSVGPPGYSEHATGYAIDFGARPSPGCADVNACFAKTPVGRWLIQHAPEYGFELSFPLGNAQGVTWEPWHWRWVGASAFQPGANAARALFVRARSNFPAMPPSIDASPYLRPIGQTPLSNNGAIFGNGAPVPLATPTPAPRIDLPPFGGR